MALLAKLRRLNHPGPKFWLKSWSNRVLIEFFDPNSWNTIKSSGQNWLSQIRMQPKSLKEVEGDGKITKKIEVTSFSIHLFPFSKSVPKKVLQKSKKVYLKRKNAFAVWGDRIWMQSKILKEIEGDWKITKKIEFNRKSLKKTKSIDFFEWIQLFWSFNRHLIHLCILKSTFRFFYFFL